MSNKVIYVIKKRVVKKKPFSDKKKNLTFNIIGTP
jgi:hypothetical protein